MQNGVTESGDIIPNSHVQSYQLCMFHLYPSESSLFSKFGMLNGTKHYSAHVP